MMQLLFALHTLSIPFLLEYESRLSGYRLNDWRKLIFGKHKMKLQKMNKILKMNKIELHTDIFILIKPLIVATATFCLQYYDRILQSVSILIEQTLRIDTDFFFYIR